MRHYSPFFVFFSYFCIVKYGNRSGILLLTIKNNFPKGKRNMEKASLFYAILSKYKYLITIVLGIFVVCFADSNSFYRRMVLHYEIMELKSEIEYYNNVYKNDQKQLRDLDRDPRNIERIARERYFMKADDEDIYVLSTDPRSSIPEMTAAEQ